MVVSRMLKGQKYLSEFWNKGGGGWLVGLVDDIVVGLWELRQETRDKRRPVYLVLLHEGVVKVGLAHRMEDVVWS